MLCLVPRSHLCIACGHDLTYLRAPPDPHYHLPVVVCPGCATACVRRPYAGAAHGRSLGRAIQAARAFWVRLVGLFVLAAANVAASAATADGLLTALRGRSLADFPNLDPAARARLTDWLALEGVYLIPLWVIAALAAGMVCAIGFPHWRLSRVPLGIGAMLAMVLLLPQLLMTPTEWAAGARSLGAVAASNAPKPREIAPFLAALAGATMILMGAAAFARSITRTTPRGLGSRRLRRARRRRRHLA